jgi:hypothetical protein
MFLTRNPMSPTFSIYRQFDSLDQSAYHDLWTACGALAFYHPDFLRAAQNYPLLPIEGVYYLTAWKDEHLEAFMVVYHQRSPDPFGTLTRTTGNQFDNESHYLFGHAAHCYDTRILTRPEGVAMSVQLFEQLKVLAGECGITTCGLLNIDAPDLLMAAELAGFQVRHLHDRFYIDLASYLDFDDFVAKLPGHGRREMKRQLRKFEAEGGYTTFEKLPATDLSEVARLCHLTSAKNGSPDYYPEETFRQFVAACGDLVSVVWVSVGKERIAAGVWLDEPGRLHLWSGGFSYVHSDFSPYTVMFASGVRHAFERGIQLIEAGRTNPRIKGRLGCLPRPLYSALSAVLT